MQRGFFITGTDTNVGKTYVSALLARSLVARGIRVGVYKPTASGCSFHNGVLQSDDALTLWQSAGKPGSLEQVCPQCFAAPLAPYLAARAAGTAINASLLFSGLHYWQENYEMVLVEGAGGFLSPVTETLFVAHLAAQFGYPVVLVAHNKIGVINQVLQTCLAVKQYAPNLSIAGVILNAASPTTSEQDPSLTNNATELARYLGNIPLIELPWQATQIKIEHWLA